MLKKILQALGLPEDATEDQALNTIGTMRTDLARAINQARTPPLDQFVPRADYDQALARATNSEQALADKARADLDAEITRVVDAALVAGKITPATRDYYAAMCQMENGLDEFRKFVAQAPVIGGASALDGHPPKDPETAMNAEELRISQMFGNTTEDIKKYGHR